MTGGGRRPGDTEGTRRGKEPAVGRGEGWKKWVWVFSYGC